ncbi:MAG TPA: adenosylmethionine--8-amino-7-oxononanoate transaminase [Ferruginibacter sp.]|nr:adenosylmethionine--8-amino-7-oxononanoate transaminase [Ferruginibacter sp.]
MTPQEKDKNYIWHPFTQMKIADTPIHITRAKGTVLYSTDGKEYIDAVSSWWVNIHGHSNEFIADRIAQQAKVLEHVIFAGFTHTPAIELSEKLINILPDNFSKIFYSDNGSTAVEVALKMALQYWHNQGIKNKTKIIALENAYHGDTFGAMSAGARSTFNAAFNPLLFEVHHIPAPDKNNVEAVKKQLLQYAGDDTVAAFIFEPLIQGSGGMLMHEATYLDELLTIAQQKNIICIADEVMTGFGRTGKNFAINYLENKPDIICLSKGITGGFLPLGVTACSQKIFDAFYSDEMEKTFFHGHSYTANPLACAAANASIELLLKESCQRQIKMINDNHKLFAEKMDKSDLVKEVRLQGTIIAIELNTSEDTSYFNSIKKEAYKFYLNNGVLLRPLGNVVYIMPPYCITKEELDKVYNVIAASLTHLL